MPIRPLNAESRNSLERAAKTFEATLPGSPAMEFLTARGTSLASVERFRLGYVSAPLPGLERFTGCLAIPNICGGLHPHVVGMKFRRLDGGEPKYDQPPVATRMFNARAIDEADEIICITEGELDTVILEQLGLHSVGIPGASAWKPHYWRLLEGFPRVVVFRDNDDAGLALEEKIRKTDLPVVCYLPPGVSEKGDVSDSYLQGHGDELIRLAHGTHHEGLTP